MTPETRKDLEIRILQDLGEPVIKVNVAPEQIDNAIDDAIEFWQLYHHEGQDRSYMKIEITQEMLDNNAIPLPESVFAVYQVYGHSSSNGEDSWMSYEFEMTRDAMFDAMKATGGGGLSSFVMTKQYLADMQHLLLKPLPFDFRYHKRELHIFGEIKKYFSVGSFILLDVQGFLYKNSYNIWGDEALRKLATAYTKKYWGNNIKKFSGVALPGGTLLNGESIYNDALQDIEKAENYILELREPLGVQMW